MNLVDGEQMVRLNAKRRRHARAVLGNVAGCIVRADAAVEAGIDALRHAAGAGKKAVADARELAERGCLQHGLTFKSGRYAERGMREGGGLEQRAHASAPIASAAFASA